MKKVIAIVLLVTLFACDDRPYSRQGRFCQNLENQRDNVIVNLSNHNSPVAAIIVAQTDSMYLKCGCDTIK